MTPDPSFLLAEKPLGELRRELGLLSSTMIVVGSMVGSGIFIVSADITRTVGSAGYLSKRGCLKPIPRRVRLS